MRIHESLGVFAEQRIEIAKALALPQFCFAAIFEALLI
jgi:hypothetical protein